MKNIFQPQIWHTDPDLKNSDVNFFYDSCELENMAKLKTYSMQ